MKIFLKILFIIFLFASGNEVHSQSVIWRQIIGEQYNEIGYNCIELRDGGYLMAGFKEILQPGTVFIIPKSYVVKLDHFGNILWEKLIGDSTRSSTSLSLIEDPSGNIYLLYSSSIAHLLKMNSAGNILWDKDYSVYNIELFRGISFVNEFKNVVLLSQNDIQGLYSSSSITKMDSSGNVLWNKVFYDSIPNISVYTSHNNSYLFTENNYYISGAKGDNAFIIKTDTSGCIIWNTRFLPYFGIYSIAQISENSFIGSGKADASGNLLCLNFDSSGNIIWSRNYINDPLAWAIGYDKIIKNYNGNFALGTTSGRNFGRIIIIDSLGGIISSKFYYYPVSFYIEQTNINNTSDSGYIVTGDLDSNNSFSRLNKRGNKQIDILIFKIDKYGNTVSIRDNNSTSNQDLNINIYPNPYNLSFNINFNILNKSEVNIILYDISGKKVKEIQKSFFFHGNYQFNVNTPELSSGIYFLKMNIDQDFYTRKILLIK